MWSTIAEHIAHVTGYVLASPKTRSLGGGCINQAYALADHQQTYFVKLNQASKLPMFEAEAAGLQDMAATKTIRVPQPICWGVAAGQCYLVMDYLDLGGRGAWDAMGRQLAAMHRATSAQGFGWHRDNTIGSTPQPNSWTADWVEFWQTHRLEHQLRLARQRGGSFAKADRLLDRLPTLFAGHHPQPSLVHGDLWSGNAAVTQTGEPVIFDPATYYGDREVDVAMTELFGGFPAEFYRGYAAEWPLDAGYEIRKILYNLYHILNHFNLFGSGYAGQCDRMIAQLTAIVE